MIDQQSGHEINFVMEVYFAVVSFTNLVETDDQLHIFNSLFKYSWSIFLRNGVSGWRVAWTDIKVLKNIIKNIIFYVHWLFLRVVEHATFGRRLLFVNKHFFFELHGFDQFELCIKCNLKLLDLLFLVGDVLTQNLILLIDNLKFFFKCLQVWLSLSHL